MRYLNIERKKSFVACLIKLKVYIEDPISPEININGIPARKLGEIGNGETGRFIIDDNSCKVFVIPDKLSKGYSNEYYTLPEGTDDVYLSGKGHFSLFAANAFRFDGVTDEEVLAHRKKMKKRGMIVSLCSVLIGVVIGIGLNFLDWDLTPQAKEFSMEGITITLTDEFSAYNREGFYRVFESDEFVVYVERIMFDDENCPSELTLRQFGDELLKQTTAPNKSELKKDDSSYYFEYRNSTYGTEYSFRAYIYKSADSFWIVQFGSYPSTVARHTDTIAEWADSVDFRVK